MSENHHTCQQAKLDHFILNTDATLEPSASKIGDIAVQAKDHSFGCSVATLMRTSMNKSVKTLIFVLCTPVCLIGKAAPIEDQLKDLERAAYFAIGNTGIGGTHPIAQDSIIAIHSNPNAGSLMASAFDHGSIASKLYVACWASSFAKDKYTTYEEILSRENSSVSVMKGSILYQESIANMLSRIRKGRCGDLLITAP